MKTPIVSAFITLTAVFGLISCSSVKSMAQGNVERLKNMRFAHKQSDIPPIVTVRKKDLRKVESGQEKILAWNRSRKIEMPEASYFPEDFDPSKLSVSGQLPSSGILPSLNSSGGGTSIDSLDPDANLPVEVTGLPEILEEP